MIILCGNMSTLCYWLVFKEKDMTEINKYQIHLLRFRSVKLQQSLKYFVPQYISLRIFLL